MNGRTTENGADKMSELTIRWIGQSGYILSDGKNTICIDPYLSDIVKKTRLVKAPIKPEELSCDAVICTHNHLDHVDTGAIPYMNRNIAFFAPTDAKETLLGCGVQKYTPFDEGQSFALGDFCITAVYAKHTVPTVGVIVKHGKTTLYFSGDTYYDKKLSEVRNFGIDIVFICINGRLGNMNAEEAVALTKEIAPKVGIPNHYGLFAENTEDPKKYTSRLECAYELQFDRVYGIEEILKARR